MKVLRILCLKIALTNGLRYTSRANVDTDTDVRDILIRNRHIIWFMATEHICRLILTGIPANWRYFEEIMTSDVESACHLAYHWNIKMHHRDTSF